MYATFLKPLILAYMVAHMSSNMLTAFILLIQKSSRYFSHASRGIFLLGSTFAVADTELFSLCGLTIQANSIPIISCVAPRLIFC
jgi:hypothetical protein